MRTGFVVGTVLVAFAAGIAVGAQQSKDAPKGGGAGAKPAQAAPPKPPQIGRCHECGQLVSACDRKHVQMVVYPLKYPQYADYFPGVFVNGVRYLSNDDGHPITVPAVAQAEIAGHVAGFERNEHEMANGRVAERHSGVVSPHGTAFNPASAAWR